MSKLSRAAGDEQRIRQAFLDAFPNPDRIGCPGDDTIRAIARKRIDSDDSVRRHMRSCSPCSQDLLTFRQQWRTAQITRLAVLAAAATILVIFGIYWRQKPSISTQPNLIARNGQTLHVQAGTLDFSGSPLRGHDRSFRNGAQRLTLTSTDHIVLVMLPVGSEPGKYEVQVRNSSLEGEPIRRLSGMAVRTVEGTKMEIDFGRAPLVAGNYGLAWRLQNENTNLWNYNTFVVN